MSIDYDAIRADLVDVERTWGPFDGDMFGSRYEIANLHGAVTDLLAVIDAVRGLHKPVTYPAHTEPFCPACSGPGAPDFDCAPYPCPTIRALDGAQKEEK